MPETQYKFEPTGEVRPPRKGELFLHVDLRNQAIFEVARDDLHCSFPIYRRVPIVPAAEQPTTGPTFHAEVPKVAGYYWASFQCETHMDLGSVWRWSTGIRITPEELREIAWFYGPLPTEMSVPAADLDLADFREQVWATLCPDCGPEDNENILRELRELRSLDAECERAFAKMEIAETHHNLSGLPYDGHEELWMRFIRDGERSPDLLAAMRDLTERMSTNTKGE